MKIGIYSPYLDTLGGGERYMLSIAECLSSSCLVNIFWNDGTILEKAKERLNLSLDNVFVVPNIFSNKPVISKVFATSKYDCIFLLSDGSIPISFAKKTILHFQQPFQDVNGKKLLNRLKFQKIPTIICNSYYTKRFIDREYSVNSSVVYPPVDVSLFKGSKAKEKIILSVGRFHEVKKHEILIRSFQKLSDKNWRLVIVGGLLEKDVNYFNFLTSLITSPNIILKPNISFTELNLLYKSARFYWHATGYGENENDHPERFEHFGIAPVEAMAAGCIPLLFKGGGMVEILDDNEELLWKNEDELIEKTTYFMKKSAEVKKIKSKLEQRSQLFDKPAFCSRIQGLVLS